MARSILTALAVERAHRSGEAVLLSDGDGLYLRKQTRHGASWTLRYHFAGRQHWLTLGNFPDMSLAQARGLKHPEVPKRYLEKYLLPRLGRQPACDITPADVARLLDEIKGRAPTSSPSCLQRFARRRASARTICSPSSCCSRCAFAKGSCSERGGKSSTSTAARNLTLFGTCQRREPRRARVSISR